MVVIFNGVEVDRLIILLALLVNVPILEIVVTLGRLRVAVPLFVNVVIEEIFLRYGAVNVPLLTKELNVASDVVELLK